MELKKLLVAGISAAMMTGLVACGGSSSNSNQTSNSRVVTGAITAFGSVYVNGVKYETDNANVYIEGGAASESDLRVGMMVSVRTADGSSAESIHHADDVEGFVIANNIAVDGTLNVMGQTVTVDSSTVFESHVAGVGAPADIAVGNIVEVTGSSDGMGSVLATRLEVKAVDLATYLVDHPNGVEVKGIVTDHNATDKTFKIGALVVNYTDAILDDLPNGIVDGLYVEAKSTENLNASNQLVAYKVELESDGVKGEHGEDDEVEVHGEVSAASASSVTVNGISFVIDANTVYEHGVAADLVVGAIVEVEGHSNAEGVLIASKVEFEEEENELELRGNVSSVSADEANNGSIVLEGITLIVNSNTIMQDDSSAALTAFNLSLLSAGDYVKVHYVDNGDGTFTATKIERKDPS